MKERGYIEQLWREEKYHVLLHSQQSYQMIRNALKTDLSLHQVQQMMDVALLIEPSIGSVCNAFDHMWGYLKNVRMKKKDNNQNYLKLILLMVKSTPKLY